MKILILGGKGMAGHVMTAFFQQKAEYEVYYTSRDPHDKNGIFLDVTNSTKLEEVIETIKPEITINCIGILNDHAAKNTKLAFQINSLLPHQLAKLSERHKGKLIHISTDCVFSGKRGNYTENDTPDGTSVYAQSKKLGEIIDDKHLTIRTSIIGPELKEDGIGLFLWFMKQKAKIKGFKNVWWNGVTTVELAKAVETFIQHEITGLYHLGSDTKISKYLLLKIIQEVFGKKDVEIIPDFEVIQDRTIISTRTDFNYLVPSYKEMLWELQHWMKSHEIYKQ